MAQWKLVACRPDGEEIVYGPWDAPSPDPDYLIALVDNNQDEIGYLSRLAFAHGFLSGGEFAANGTNFDEEDFRLYEVRAYATASVQHPEGD